MFEKAVQDAPVGVCKYQPKLNQTKSKQAEHR